MRALSLDVRIVSSSQNVDAKLKWIEKHFRNIDWKERAIFLNDLNLLSNVCHFFLHSDPSLLECRVGIPSFVSTKVKYKLVLFEQPYNNNQFVQIAESKKKIPETEVRRMSKWKVWKSSMGLDNVPGNILWYQHGSEDSRDKDVYFVFEKMPTSSDCFNFISGVEEDRSIVCVDEKFGVFSSVMKGNKDECNNSLFSTYKLHKQSHPLLLKRKVTRLVALKWIGTIRKLIGKCSNVPIYESKVKEALKFTSSLQTRFELFKEINLSLCESLTVSDLKSIAFQFAQTISLIDGKELYTKKEVAEHFEDLNPFMYRQEEKMRSSIDVLMKYKRILVEKSEALKWREFTSNRLVLFYCDAKVDNHLLQQCNSLVVDSLSNLVLSFPFENKSSLNSPDWVMPGDSWPNLPPPIRFATFFSILYNKKNDHVLCTKNNQFLEISEIEQNMNLDFEKYFYSFVEVGGNYFLAGLRLKATNCFTERKEMEEEAKRISKSEKEPVLLLKESKEKHWWDTETHFFFSKNFCERVFLFLLCLRRYEAGNIKFPCWLVHEMIRESV